MADQGDRCNTLFYRHKCLTDEPGPGPTEEFENIRVTDCSILNLAQIDTICGVSVHPQTEEDGCFHHKQEDPPTNAPPFFPQSTLVDTDLVMRDIRDIHVQQIVETNIGGGIELVAASSVRVGPPGATTLFVNEIRDIVNISAHVPIEFFKTKDIDEYSAGTGITIRPNTNFLNAINFGLPGGNFFQYDRTNFSVTFRGMTAGVPVAGVPLLALGTMVMHRYGNAAGAPMVTALFGTSIVTMANAPFDYYESLTAVIPAAYRPTQNYTIVISGERFATHVTKLCFLTFMANGFIRNTPIGSGPAVTPFEDTFIGGDNGLFVGIRAGSVSYECVTS